MFWTIPKHNQSPDPSIPRYPLDWFLERIGKRIFPKYTPEWHKEDSAMCQEFEEKGITIDNADDAWLFCKAQDYFGNRYTETK